MKKYIIGLIVGLCINYNANSEDLKNRFYIVGDLGFGKNSSKLEESIYNSMKTSMPEGLKIESNRGFIGSIGLGYKFTNDIRFDFKIGADKSSYNYKPDSLKEISPVPVTTHKAERVTEFSKEIKIEARDLDLSINGYYDFPNLFKGIRPFVLGGIGVANKKVKTKCQGVNSITKVEHLKEKDKDGKEKDKIVETVEYLNEYSDSHVYKSKFNPFYTLGLGVSFTHNDTPDATIDLAYKFKKSFKDSFKEEGGNEVKIKSHAHYFMMGIRYHF
jgi:opacity protein-like surface antigen